LIIVKRPLNHVKETESFAYVEDTLKEWVPNRLNNDYGIDYDIQIFEKEEGTELNFGAQIKSTESSNVDKEHYKYSLDTEHIDYFFKQNRPILLIVYDIPSKNAFWVVMQDYVWDVLNKENPNWLNQRSSTIKLPLRNLLTDKKAIKIAVKSCFKRIAVKNFHNLSIEDGLGLNETLEDIEKLKAFEEKTEYVLNNKKILLAQKLAITGDYETVFKKLNEVYSQQKNDIAHLRAIIALVTYSNIAIEEENKKLVQLADEGLKIAELLDEKIGFAILLVYRAQALHLTLTRRITESLYAKKAMGHMDIAYIINLESDKKIKELNEALTKVSLEVREAFKILIQSQDYFTLAYLLTINLHMTTMTIQQISVIVGKDKFIDEIKQKDILAQHLINLIKVFNDETLEINIRESVANYYYYTRGAEDALIVIEPALKIAEKLKDQPQFKKIKMMINTFKARPDPYQVEDRKFEELSIKEVKELTIKHIELMGENLSDGSDNSSALNWGLKDMDPEPYLKTCEELHIHYSSTSYLGQMTGVHSIGFKLLWCKQGQVTVDQHLNSAFEIHKEKYCKDCTHKKPRSKDWTCKWGWFWKREIPKPMQDFKENMKKW